MVMADKKGKGKMRRPFQGRGRKAPIQNTRVRGEPASKRFLLKHANDARGAGFGKFSGGSGDNGPDEDTEKPFPLSKMDVGENLPKDIK